MSKPKENVVEIESFIAECKEEVRRKRIKGLKISKRDAPSHFAWAIVVGLEICPQLPLELYNPAMDLILKCLKLHKKGATRSRKS